MYGDDPGADFEALQDERYEADCQQYEMEQVGRAIRRAEKAGRCCHGSVVGYLSPPIYPEQKGLNPGECKCTAGCGQVFTSDQDWHAAMDAAIAGFL
jgi:hypothetical protein